MEGYLKLYKHELYHPPATPYVTAIKASVKALADAVFVCLPLEDEALLAEDPGKLDRYIRFALSSWLPPLRHIVAIVPTKLHLAELPGITALEALIGHTSSWLAGSLTALFSHTISYASQFDAVADAWAAGDYSMLQPAAANYLWPVMLRSRYARVSPRSESCF